MDILLIIGGVIIAYLVGSIPTAVWYSRVAFGLDVREFGSGNAGATNTFRVLGKKAGAFVMFCDVLKGFSATYFATVLVLLNAISADKLELWMLVFGLAGALGHIFPIYVKFKGGKGVATLLGMILAINFYIAMICIATFVIVLIISRYVSLGSILATLAFPIALFTPRFSPDEPLILVFAFVLFTVVVITHQKNIKRIINGEENKAKLRLKKQKEK